MAGTTYRAGASKDAEMGSKEKAHQKESRSSAASSPGYPQEGHGFGTKSRAKMLLPPGSKQKILVGTSSHSGAGKNASLGPNEQVCQRKSGNLAKSSPSSRHRGRSGGARSPAEMQLLLGSAQEAPAGSASRAGAGKKALVGCEEQVHQKGVAEPS